MKADIPIMSTESVNEEKPFIFVGGHGWMYWVDKVYLQGGCSSTQSHESRFEGFEMVMKEKNDTILQLRLDNANILEELLQERVHTKCLRKYLKGTLPFVSLGFSEIDLGII
ncbi:hypothetical protein Leryth_024968 [Lithospermum erythrorhizon]|nr:hypothetical protein Leryth_024968 [Lithospermum erythrorhizon]